MQILIQSMMSYAKICMTTSRGIQQMHEMKMTT